MATCCISQTGAIFELLAISKPWLRFRRSLYRFQTISPHLSSGTLRFPSWGQVLSFLVKTCLCIAYRIPHIISCSCVGCLLCCVLLFRCCFFGLVPIMSCCEDSFDYVRLSSSWTRSSSLRDFRQDDHTLEITSIFACLVARSFAMPMLRYLPLAYHASYIVEPSL